MTEKKQVRTTPFSLRFTDEERTILEAQAGTLPLGAFMRSRLLENPYPRKKIRRITQEHELVLQVLRRLGKSRISNILNQIAKAINTGKLVVSDEGAEGALIKAQKDIEIIKATLIKALGFYLKDET